MKFSVVIPTYNEEKRIAQCLKSIQAQTFKDYEIIIADSSTDRTPQVVKKFRGVKLYKVHKNAPGPARNAGAKHARGEILFFIDADCVVDKDILEETARVFDSSTVAVSYRRTSIEGNLLYDFFFKHVTTPLFVLRKWLATVYSIRRTTFWKVGGFDERLQVDEDIDIAQKLVKHGEIKYLPRVGIARHSIRRIYKQGLLGTGWMYARQMFIWLLFGERTKYFHPNED